MCRRVDRHDMGVVADLRLPQLARLGGANVEHRLQAALPGHVEPGDRKVRCHDIRLGSDRLRIHDLVVVKRERQQSGIVLASDVRELAGGIELHAMTTAAAGERSASDNDISRRIDRHEFIGRLFGAVDHAVGDIILGVADIAAERDCGQQPMRCGVDHRDRLAIFV